MLTTQEGILLLTINKAQISIFKAMNCATFGAFINDVCFLALNHLQLILVVYHGIYHFYPILS